MNKIGQKLLIPILSLGLVGGGIALAAGGQTVFASPATIPSQAESGGQSGKNTENASQHAAQKAKMQAEREQQFQKLLDCLVSKNAISKTDADQAMKAIKDAEGQEKRPELPDAVTKALESLRETARSLTQEQRDTLRSRMKAARNEVIQQAIKDGTISSDQGDALQYGAMGGRCFGCVGKQAFRGHQWKDRAPQKNSTPDSTAPSGSSETQKPSASANGSASVDDLSGSALMTA